MHLFAMLLMVSCTLGFVACSDDDDPAHSVTAATMYGTYEGWMTTRTIAPLSDEAEDEPTGTPVKVRVDQDTLYFDSFPIRDIVFSILKDETLTDQIVESVGDISYKIGYTPAVASDGKRIDIALDPKPLTLTLALPSAQEGEEAQALLIEVDVEAAEGAAYQVEEAAVNFVFGATSVRLGEGENQVTLPGFQVTTFDFQLNQYTLTHH